MQNEKWLNWVYGPLYIIYRILNRKDLVSNFLQTRLVLPTTIGDKNSSFGVQKCWSVVESQPDEPMITGVIFSFPNIKVLFNILFQ